MTGPAPITENPWTATHRGAAPSVAAVSPWVRQPAAPTTQVTSPSTGPLHPQSHVRAPEGGLPIAEPTTARASLWVVGAHGGAGESSVAALEDGWTASGHSWPVLDTEAPAQCVVVARTSVAGLLAARTALTQWASASIGPSARVVGLVLIADAPGKLPAALRDLAKVVAGGAPRIWEIPWVEAWRLGEPPATARPRAATRLVNDLRSLVSSATAPDATTMKGNR